MHSAYGVPKRPKLVYADTGKQAPEGSKKGKGADGREIITYQSFCRRKDLVYADTGEKAPEGSKKGKDADGREIIYSNTFYARIRGRKNLVFADTGEKAPEGSKKGKGADGREIIYSNTFWARIRGRKNLVFADTGEKAPEGSIEGKTADGREIISRSAFYRRKLVFANTGGKAPEGSKKGKGADGREIISYGAFYERNKLVFADTGKEAPNGSKKGQIVEGREIITHYSFRQRNSLVFADTGEKAPEGSKKGKGADGREIVIYHTFLMRKRKQKKPSEKVNGKKKLKSTEQKKNQHLPAVGIAKKYLPIEGETPALPFPKTSHPKITTYQKIIHLKKLKNDLEEKKSLIGKKYLEISINEKNFNADFIFISTKKLPDPREYSTFVFAGRGLNALMPESTDRSRIILVMPSNQYESLKQHIPENVDVLVVQKLESTSHGKFENMGLITVRRIAAFLFAYELQLSHCIMMDDNIETVKLASTSSSPDDAWENFYCQLLLKNEKNHSVCTSVQTESYGIKTHQSNKLGSKLFLFDMKAIRSTLKKGQMFLLFPPASCADWWGEDYFMQLMLYQVFSKTGCQGHYLLDEAEFCLTRSKKNKNAFLNSFFPKKATIYLSSDVLENIDVRQLENHEVEWIRAVHKNLQEVIRSNIAAHQLVEEKKKKADLIKKHAIAQGIESTSIPPYEVKGHENLSHKKISDQLKKNIEIYMKQLEKILRKHQIDSLKTLSKFPGNVGLFNMATGSGKTILQITLVYLLHAIGTSRPIVIVTQDINLVKQFYLEFVKARALFEGEKFIPIDEAHIIKSSSQGQDVNSALLSHDSLKDKNLIFIICKASFLSILKAKNTTLNPAIVLLDESHLFSKNEMKTVREFYEPTGVTTFAFTATPKNEEMPEIFKYTMQQGMEEGILTPLIIDKFKEEYSEENYKAFLENLPLLLKSHLHPSGNTLDKLKGIIYFTPGTQLDKVKFTLETHGIFCYIIRSDQKNVQERIKEFQKDSRPVIALAINMLRVGFDDVHVEWSIVAQPAHNDNVLTQQAGRTVRTRENNIAKRGYMLTFQNANINQSKFTFSHPASFFVNKQYEVQRKKNPSLRPPLESFDEKISNPLIVQSITRDLLNGNTYPFTKEKLQIIEKRDRLLHELEKLENQLKEIVKPKTAPLILYPASFLKPTGPWDGEPSAKKRKHEMSVLESRIAGVKKALEELGVPKDKLYREGFGMKKQKFLY